MSSDQLTVCTCQPRLIHERLDQLEEHMKAMVYVVDLDFALHDVDG